MSSYPVMKLVLPFAFSIFITELSGVRINNIQIIYFLIYSLLAFRWIAEIKKYRGFANSLIYGKLILLGFIAHQNFWAELNNGQVSALNEKSFLLATIFESEKKGDYFVTRAKLNFLSIKSNLHPHNSPKLLIYFKGNSQPKVGDKVLVHSKINSIKKNKNPKSFDYKRFMERKGIQYQLFLKSNQWIHLGHTYEHSFKTYAAAIRERLYEHLKHALQHEENLSIISAMLLGNRSLISDETNEDFKRTGAVHVLAVSGLHVGIISSLFQYLFTFFKFNSTSYKIFKLSALLIGVWGFALISGASYSVLRAATMFSLYYIGRSISRPTNIYNIIGFTAFIMLIFEPMSIFDVGFQFSFLALISIIYFFGKIESILYFKHRLLKKIWQLIVLSLAAQILVFPLSIFYFHMFPVYFWMSGIAVVPLAGASIATAILTLLSSIIGIQFLTSCFAQVLNVILSVFRNSTSVIEGFPFSCVEDIYVDFKMVCLMYTVIVVFILFLNFKKIKMFLCGFICYLIMTAYQINSKLSAWKSIELCVYDIYKNSLIDLFKEGNIYSFHDTDLSDKQIHFNAYNHRISYYLQESTSTRSRPSANDLIFLQGNSFLIFPKQFIHLKTKCLDYLILNKSSLHQLESYLKSCEINNIIFDSSIIRLNPNIIEELNSRSIGYHHTIDYGPFIYKS